MPVDPELDGRYPLRIHHVVRGGLIMLGIGIGTMSLVTSAGSAVAPTVVAPAAHRAVVTVASDDAGAQAVPVLAARAASPAVAAETHADEAEPVTDPHPDYPVVQAGPGPATPVEGAITLIDPLVIER